VGQRNVCHDFFRRFACLSLSTSTTGETIPSSSGSSSRPHNTLFLLFRTATTCTSSGRSLGSLSPDEQDKVGDKHGVALALNGAASVNVGRKNSSTALTGLDIAVIRKTDEAGDGDGV